ncbi:hypothetical protein [Glaciecola sp. KUL10]|uniref:hypothetical protein n=1 Tax=Glaciecola sp. (strain KUL10) TaxID=2161813 RepID=UPI000D9DD619|nr:hypothetical protein [Glaciecola sp. KUL10]GBL05941.1 hypothetical protein KUL10_32740 [Glaciecola sp. KUL10]
MKLSRFFNAVCLEFRHGGRLMPLPNTFYDIKQLQNFDPTTFGIVLELAFKVIKAQDNYDV